MNDPTQEILTYAFRNSYAELRFPEIQFNLNQVIEGTCYQAILEIKKVLADPSLQDNDCFCAIEQIVRILESHGISGEGRHDFG